MKKRSIALIAALCLAAFGFGGCAKSPFEKFDDTAKTYAQRAVALNDAVREKYWQDIALFCYHYYPNFTEDASGDMSTAFVWPYTETVAADWRIATLSSGAKKEIAGQYKKALEGFEYYRAFRDDYHVYCADRKSVV